MQKILNSVRMAQPKVACTIMIRVAVGECLQKNLDAMRLNVVKLPWVDLKKGSQKAEIDVYMPNKTIRNLGLPVSKQILDCQQCLPRLDRQSAITAYGLTNLIGKSV